MTEFQIVPPPADGLADAFRSAAGRRRRTAATTGSAGLLSAALVFAALTGGAGQVLTQEPAPPARELPILELVPAPAATERATLDAPKDPAGAATDRGSTGRSDPQAAPDRPSNNTADSLPGSRSAGTVADIPARSPNYRPGPMTRSSYTSISTDVPGVTCSSDGALCSSVGLSGSSADARLIVQVCNGGTEPERLDFASRDEVDVTVSANGRTLWSWAAGRSRVADPHQVPIGVSQCLQWETPWAFVDQSGRPLPSGSYVLTARVDSPDLGTAGTATNTATKN